MLDTVLYTVIDIVLDTVIIGWMVGNLLKYICAKKFSSRWSSDKAIAKI